MRSTGTLNPGRESRPFSLSVSIAGQRAVQMTFDQDKVVVGRGEDCDLRLEHAGVSRTQFLLERGIGSQGESRFRITPFESTNPTLINERPAVEGTVVPGDIIAITEVRVVLDRVLAASKSARDKRAKGEQISPLRMALFTAVAAVSLWLGYVVMNEPNDVQDSELATAQIKLFQPTDPLRCPNPVECSTRAIDAYKKGKGFYNQANSDVGNLYRAATELDRAAEFVKLTGRALDETSDLNSYQTDAHRRVEAAYQDGRFRLQRAMAQNDLKRALAEADHLARLIPDDKHPYRVMLDAYRRGLAHAQEKTPQ